MPRRARLDTPGTLHHVIVREIKKRGIVDDRWDRDTTVPFTISPESRASDMLCITRKLGLVCRFCSPDRVQGRLGS